MNYSIIKDPEELKKFIDWLPDLDSHETYYVCLMVRSKYCTGLSHIRSDKVQLKRFTCTKERLFSKIQQLECKVGTYLQRDVEVPQEGLAIYITPNPRDMQRAMKNCLIRFAQLVTQPYAGTNPHQEVLSEIQKAGNKKYYVDFDFDFPKDQDKAAYKEVILSQVAAVINPICVHVLETRGGIHVMVETDKVEQNFKKSWYSAIKKIPGCDQVSSDNMIPIPGCSQGNFVPTLRKLII